MLNNVLLGLSAVVFLALLLTIALAWRSFRQFRAGPRVRSEPLHYVPLDEDVPTVHVNPLTEREKLFLAARQTTRKLRDRWGVTSVFDKNDPPQG